MEIKWFFVIIGLFLTFAILTGMYFITNFALLQQQKYYEDSKETAIQRFDNSTVVHKFLFDNITELRIDWKNKLAPLLDQIPNATQSRIDQQLHYNQTTQDFQTIKQILKIKLQDHETLLHVNNTVNQIAAFLFNQTISNNNGSIIVDNTTKPVPAPLNNTNKTQDGGIIIENITGKNS